MIDLDVTRREFCAVASREAGRRFLVVEFGGSWAAATESSIAAFAEIALAIRTVIDSLTAFARLSADVDLDRLTTAINGIEWEIREDAEKR